MKNYGIVPKLQQLLQFNPDTQKVGQLDWCSSHTIQLNFDSFGNVFSGLYDMY
ncbi:hypothetical protein V6Z11_A04G141200 [Gossypium hirsutum]